MHMRRPALGDCQFTGPRGPVAAKCSTSSARPLVRSRVDAIRPIPELTGLRFVAAFAVLLLHYRELLGPLPDWVFRGLIGGQYGVTLFFVLSGFVLTYNYLDWFARGVQEKQYLRFQRLRFARIYPIYVFGLLLDTPWHLIERVQTGQLAASGHEYWASWLLNLFGLQAWVPRVPYAMFWNAPAWSVSAEFFFYATFPFVCSWLARHIRSQAGLLGALLIVVGAGTAIYAVTIHAMTYSLHASDQTRYIVMAYNPLLRYSEFLAGCLVGQYFIRARGGAGGWGARLFASAAGRNTLLAICLIAIGLRIWSQDYTGPSAALWLLDVSIKYSVFILPFAGVIIAVACGRTFLSWLLAHPWMILLGEASYALYIIHWSGQTFLRMRFLGDYGTPLVHTLFLVATVGASVLCYRLIEVPMRRRLRGTTETSVMAVGKLDG